MSNEIQLDLKRQLLNGIHCTIKYISGMFYFELYLLLVINLLL